jgi:hypothetical protein
MRVRATWGADFDGRRDSLLEQGRARPKSGADFTGSKKDMLLCMARLVTSAPCLGLPEEAIRAQLAGLLAQLLA